MPEPTAASGGDNDDSNRGSHVVCRGLLLGVAASLVSADLVTAARLVSSLVKDEKSLGSEHFVENQ